MTTLLEQFVAEATDLLDQLDEGLLCLERDPGDAELVNVVFRAAHTIKGSSGLFDFPALTALTHAGEDLLDAVRGQRAELSPGMVDDLLEAVDVLRGWLEVIARTGALPADAAERGAGLAGSIRAHLGDSAPVRPVATPDGRRTPEPEGAPAPGWLAVFGEEWLEETANWLAATGASLRVGRYQPDPDCFFCGVDPLHTVRALPALDRLHIAPVEPWPAPAEFDEYRCVLGFTLATRATLGELQYLFRYAATQVQFAEVEAASLRALLTPAAGTSAAPVDVLTVARSVLLAQLEVLAAAASDRLPGQAAAAAQAVRGALAVCGLDATAAEPALSAAAAGDPWPLRTYVEAWLADWPGPEPQAVAAPDTADLPPVFRADDLVRESTATVTGPRTIKIDAGRVDHLLELVGELVVAKNALPYLADAAEGDGCRPLARRIKDEYAVVDRITGELQQAVMDVRMLPMSVAFARFPRLVRDLARRLGKSVELVIDGEDAAADKDTIEMLGDPLVHLVRNSLDHGLELPEQRRAAGKPETGRLRLHAEADGDSIVIELADDGRGIDAEVMRQKAYERGLITEDQLGSMPDDEAVNLIFRAGFSTKEAVSEVSGRGVGMDAVRASVQRLGGTVSLSTRPGAGSAVRLRLPVSMAITQVMVIRVAEQRFGVPVETIVETVRIPADKVSAVLHDRVVVLRGEIVPVIDLAVALEMETAAGDHLHTLSLLVVELAGQRVALAVDGFHTSTEVIVKPLAEVLAGVTAFSGTALLGDGDVLLVLDVKAVMDHVGAGR